VAVTYFLPGTIDFGSIGMDSTGSLGAVGTPRNPGEPVVNSPLIADRAGEPGCPFEDSMAVANVTKPTVDAALKHAERYTIFDPKLKRLDRRVVPSGEKSRVIEYGRALEAAGLAIHHSTLFFTVFR
jgi:hypothetical protein